MLKLISRSEGSLLLKVGMINTGELTETTLIYAVLLTIISFNCALNKMKLNYRK